MPHLISWYNTIITNKTQMSLCGNNTMSKSTLVVLVKKHVEEPIMFAISLFFRGMRCSDVLSVIQLGTWIFSMVADYPNRMK